MLDVRKDTVKNIFLKEFGHLIGEGNQAIILWFYARAFL